ncbi:hypothetical protein BCR34DRAFT_481290, partial [Clohesyomyces aquaticus]
LIDLSRLNTTSISTDHQIASVGLGAHWGEVFNYLDPFNVTVLGIRIPRVGVGGLILGGGISHFTSEYGMVADTLKNVEVVLADGPILTANPEEDFDLFWALKGGGSNFGIATRFGLATVPIKNIWFQSTLYAPDQAFAILEAFAAWQGGDDLKGPTIIALTPAYYIVGLVYAAPIEKPPTFAPFYEKSILQPAVPSTIGTVASLREIIGRNQPKAPLRYVKVNVELYREVYSFWLRKATEVNAAAGANMTFVVQHISKNAFEVGNKNGGNPLRISVDIIPVWTSVMDWTQESEDELVRSVGIETTAKWREAGKATGSEVPFIYMNDASTDQDPLASYPATGVARLKAIAIKFDRSGIFQTLKKGGFL